MALWTDQDLEAVTVCAVCGGKPSSRYANLHAHGEGTWSLLQCPGCDTSWLSPRPTLASIGKAYEGAYPPYNQSPWRPTPTSRRARARRAVADAHLSQRYGYQLRTPPWARAAARIAPTVTRAADRLVRYAPAPQGHGRLLDVGSSHGAYVALMQELGWDAHGLELDAGAVGRAREAGLQVRQAVMADLAPEIDGTFDYITIGHAIEHVHDPAASLAAVRSVLAPGGSLWLATPNMRSLGQRVFRSRWRALDPPRHLVLFTPESLTRALTDAGFDEVKMVRPIASATWNVRESARVAGLPGKAARIAGVLGHAVNAISYRRWDLADEMALVAR